MDIGQVRAGVESSFSWGDVPSWFELLGTLALDDRRLVVLYRDLESGEVHRVHSDIEDIRVGVPADTLERLVGEVYTETIHPLSFRTYRGVDRWGVHVWDLAPDSPAG